MFWSANNRTITLEVICLIIFPVFLDGSKQIRKQADTWKWVRVGHPILIMKAFICFFKFICRADWSLFVSSYFTRTGFSLCLSQWEMKVNVSFQRWHYYKGCDWDLLTKDELKDLDHQFRAHTSLAKNTFNCENDKQRIWVKVELKCSKVTSCGV